MVKSLSLSGTKKWEGISIVSGYAKGKARVLRSLSEYENIKSDFPKEEQKKFHSAIKLLENEFVHVLKTKISQEQKKLLEISRMLLQDRGWNRKIEDVILKGFSAQAAICQITKDIEKQMAKIDDLYLRERMNDFRDLATRLIYILENMTSKKNEKASLDSIILVGESLGPAQLMDYDLSKIKGIVLTEGSLTMHVAIVARAYNIPFIGGVRDISKEIQPNDFIAMNAQKGVLYKNPSDEILNELNLEEEKEKRQLAIEVKNKNKPAFTVDGKKIELGVNLGLADDLLLANVPPFDKVGLYRTELPFMLTKKLPDCDE